MSTSKILRRSGLVLATTAFLDETGVSLEAFGRGGAKRRPVVDIVRGLGVEPVISTRGGGKSAWVTKSQLKKMIRNSGVLNEEPEFTEDTTIYDGDYYGQELAAESPAEPDRLSAIEAQLAELNAKLDRMVALWQ